LVQFSCKTPQLGAYQELAERHLFRIGSAAGAQPLDHAGKHAEADWR
jgi:hypothetical protein